MLPGLFIKFALTGGPCAGKTTLQSKLSDSFSNAGWKVFRASEVATFILKGGVDFKYMSREEVYKFQKNLLHTVFAVEQLYEDLAKASVNQGCNCIIICDRGAMDISACTHIANVTKYMKCGFVDMHEEDWKVLLQEINQNETQIRDLRYDCVIHLATAANGAAEHYTLDNNIARMESVEEALEIDRKLMLAWMAHPYFIMIDNSSHFDDKINRTIQAAMSFAGVEDIRSIRGSKRRKFLVPKINFDTFPSGNIMTFELEHIMLRPSDDAKTFYRLRRRSSNGFHVFTLSSTKEIGGKLIESRRNLDGEEFAFLLQHCDPGYKRILKLRRCFIWNNHFYKCDHLKSTNLDMILLEAFIPAHFEMDDIPPFIARPIKEVTDDPNYKLINISKNI